MQIHPFVILEFSQLQYSKFFSILPFPGQLCYEFLDELFLGFPILLGARLVLSVFFADLIRIVEFHAMRMNLSVRFAESHVCTFYLLILAHLSQIWQQKEPDSFAQQEVISYDIPQAVSSPSAALSVRNLTVISNCLQFSEYAFSC